MGLGELPIDLSDVPGWVWLLAVVPVISAISSAIGFVRRNVEQKFWRESGKVSTLITFVLLVIAYAFYGDQQKRSVWDALKDLGMDQVQSILPVAIMTQFVLLGLFWLVFGRILDTPWLALLEPGFQFLSVAVMALHGLAYTVLLLSILHGDVGGAVAGVAGSLMMSYFFAVMVASPELKLQGARPRAARRRRSAVGRLFLGSGADDRSRWARSIGEIVGSLLGCWLFFGLFTLIVVAVVKARDRGVPSVGGAVRVELIVLAVLLLLACFMFREAADSVAERPPALFAFVDLSLAFSAGVVALTGLPESEVTLGPVPVLVVAVGPPLVVALTIFLSHLVRLRRKTHRWGVALAASVGAGLVVLPVKLLLTAALIPLVGLLPLPSW